MIDMIIEKEGIKIEFGLGSSTGHPDFKGVQTNDIKEWIKVDGSDWHKLNHIFSKSQIIQLIGVCENHIQIYKVLNLITD